MKFAPDYVVLFWFGLYRTEAPRDDLRMRAILGGGSMCLYIYKLLCESVLGKWIVGVIECKHGRERI